MNRSSEPITADRSCELPEAFTLEEVPCFRQTHTLSCEAAAAAVAMVYVAGRGHREEEIATWENQCLDFIGTDPDMNRGFRGNVDHPDQDRDNVGVYAPPIARYVGSKCHWGLQAEILRVSRRTLQGRLSEGKPVVAWTTRGCAPPYLNERIDLPGGRQMKLVLTEHAVVAIGYDRRDVRVMDVLDGCFKAYPWDLFLERAACFDGMAIAVSRRPLCIADRSEPGLPWSRVLRPRNGKAHPWGSAGLPESVTAGT